ncbi:MAG: PepSY-associated TM helix domain-containing protein [Steroidobacteraceae bacterium]
MHPSRIDTSRSPASAWQRWVRQPQRVGFRKALFQVHLWCGISFGLYLLFISVTGSVLVYRNELYEAVIHDPPVSRIATPVLTDAALADAAVRQYPGYEVTGISRAADPTLAVEIRLERHGRIRERYFDPGDGADVGNASNAGMSLVTKLIELHADLLAGSTGRQVNAVGALALLTSALTGLVIWWPGIKRWRRSLTLRRGLGWRRFNWDLHSAIGIWSYLFIVTFALSGLYLSTPETFHGWADRLFPQSGPAQDLRWIDTALSWLAFSHFGRINGIGLPCDGPGLCDQATKATWAIFGLAPAAMFTTGSLMWWNRVLRHRRA